MFQLEARDEDAAAALLSRGTVLNYVNVPEGDVASGARWNASAASCG